jgi:membrane complex biogenesis BtpA family protein
MSAAGDATGNSAEMEERGVTNPLLHTLFGTSKPVIAMVHFPPLPGTPLYDEAAGVAGILRRVRSDVERLLAGGVDGLLFCNEGDRPYALKAGAEAVAVMTRVITEVAQRQVPHGVDFLWDAQAAIAMALATGAGFVREVFTGVYESDMGLWSPDAAAVLRYRRAIGAGGVRLLCNITPEFASPLGTRSIEQRARSAVFSSLVDALLVSGLTAGRAPDPSWIREAKEAAGDVPVLLNTGARADTIGQFLKVADGVIVGSALKIDGHIWNPVDEARVREFVAAVRAVR